MRKCLPAHKTLRKNFIVYVKRGHQTVEIYSPPLNPLNSIIHKLVKYSQSLLLHTKCRAMLRCKFLIKQAHTRIDKITGLDLI